MLKPIPTFSSYDWFMIFESILLLSSNFCFCQLFGQTKIELSLRSYQALQLTKTPLIAAECPLCDKMRTECENGYACNNCKKAFVTSIPKICIDDDCGDLVVNNRCASCDYEFCLVEKVFLQVQRNYGDDYVSLDPLELKTYNRWVHIQPIKSLSDVNHFGHLPFEFCQLSERINASKRLKME